MAEKENKYEDRIESESESRHRTTNEDMVCKDCVYKVDDTVNFGNTSKCLLYGAKPNKVILGKKCEGYMKED